MSEPPGRSPAERRSLIGDADRERFVTILREHYAAGRMELEELRRRVGVVLAAYADEAATALAGLPPIASAGAGREGVAGGRMAGGAAAARRGDRAATGLGPHFRAFPRSVQRHDHASLDRPGRWRPALRARRRPRLTRAGPPPAVPQN
ncbi:MAG: DUF1707 domain-containing protein [Streptosporangiaceae bacterium]